MKGDDVISQLVAIIEISKPRVTNPRFVAGQEELGDVVVPEGP